MPSASQISQDAALMLKRLGLKSPDELFASVPANLRYPKLDLDDPLSELEALGEARALAARNANPDAFSWFLGAGQYRHFIPSLVESLSGRFADQAGSLAVSRECRDLIAGLCGMETASLRAPGGAEALAEAVLAALAAGEFSRPRVDLPRKLPPECLRLLESRLRPLGVELALYRDSPREAAKGMDKRSSCLVVANPDFSGEMFDLSGVAARVHDAGSLLIVLFDPIMLGLFKSPGEYGADFAVADGQSLGNHMGRKGSCFGIVASGRDRAGLLPGPPAVTEGPEGLLSAADQSPERSLAALRAAFYLCSMGKLGLRKAAELCWHKAHYLAARISLLPGCSIENRLFFKEFTVRLPVSAQDASSSLERAGFVPGLSLSSFYPERANELLVAVTEMNPRAQLDAFAAAIKERL